MMDTFPIFSQPWWLDAVAPGSWGEVQVKKNGELHARLPYVVKHTRGFTMLGMPPLTQTLGPWLRPVSGKYASQLAQEKDLMLELIQQLPRYHLFQQNFHHSVNNWLPFYWEGFSQTTRYSYILDDLTDLNVVWDGLSKNIRTDIRKAEKILTVRTDLGLDTFMLLNEMVFKRQGLSLPYARDVIERIDRACETHESRCVFFAQDSSGRVHACVYLVWDNRSAYYLMGGGDPELRNSGATSLCLWEAIKFASTVTRSFDFEGSMIESVERYFRAFGARQVPYFRISRTNSILARVGQDVSRWFKK